MDIKINLTPEEQVTLELWTVEQLSRPSLTNEEFDSIFNKILEDKNKVEYIKIDWESK